MKHLHKSGNHHWFETGLEKQIEGDELQKYSQFDSIDSTEFNLDHTPLVGTSTPTQVTHKVPKWATQVLKEVKSRERNTKCTRSSRLGPMSFYLATNVTNDSSTFIETIEHEGWRKKMDNGYEIVIKNFT